MAGTMRLFDLLDPTAASPRRLSVETPLGELVLRLEADGTALGDGTSDEALATRTGGIVQGWDTAYGRLEILAAGYDPAVEWDPGLITAMGLLMRLRITRSIHSLRVSFGWHNPEQAPAGGYDGGEQLMAATYESSEYRVTLGTDDGEALRHLGEEGNAVPRRIASRLHADGDFEVDGTYDPLIETTQNALVLLLRDLWPGDPLELVFAVAWQPMVEEMLDAARDACGTWYAVDGARSLILAGHEADSSR